MKINNNEYMLVNDRVKVFKKEYPGYAISNEIVSIADGVVVFKSTVLDENGMVKSVGHAYEKEGSSFINKTSYIENCETSAVGRALGFLGIGIDQSIASAEEVQNAILNQGKKKTPVLEEEPDDPFGKDEQADPKTIKEITTLADLRNVKVSTICEQYKVATISLLTREQAAEVKARLMKTEKK